MTDRIWKLRKQSLSAVPHLSPERAVLVTECSRNSGVLSAPMRRAMTFKTLMERKAICLSDGELIVGERGPGPRATYTYPELCCHSLEDLEILNTREKISFKVDEEMCRVYGDKIIPHWAGQTIRDRIFQEMTSDWKTCYEAGIFTEFMEQRSPGHTALDGKIYRKGMLDFKDDIRRSLEALDFLDDPQAFEKKEELEAMAVCADAIVTLAHRHEIGRAHV